MHLFDQFGNINNRIHFIGVAGIGMSGLAMLVAKKGAIVSGSDLVSSGEIVENLKKFGVKFSPKHDIGNINDKIDLVVTSSAISVDNCELQQAYALGIKVIPRAKLLALVMQNQVGVAVTGTHGKTTTTSILGNILTFSQLDPTIVVGGKVINNNNLQIRVGKGDLFIAEADESDASFLYLTPFLAVLTSFDLDHMENFQGDKAKLGQAFIDFLHLLPANGVAVVSADDQNLAEILNKVHRRCISYGFSQDADYRIDGYRLTEGLYHFELWSPENIKESYSIKQSGRHNVLNAVAAIVAAKQLGVSVEDIKNSLLFAGVGYFVAAILPMFAGLILPTWSALASAFSVLSVPGVFTAILSAAYATNIASFYLLHPSLLLEPYQNNIEEKRIYKTIDFNAFKNYLTKIESKHIIFMSNDNDFTIRYKNTEEKISSISYENSSISITSAKSNLSYLSELMDSECESFLSQQTQIKC